MTVGVTGLCSSQCSFQCKGKCKRQCSGQSKGKRAKDETCHAAHLRTRGCGRQHSPTGTMVGTTGRATGSATVAGSAADSIGLAGTGSAAGRAKGKREAKKKARCKAQCKRRCNRQHGEHNSVSMTLRRPSQARWVPANGPILLPSIMYCYASRKVPLYTYGPFLVMAYRLRTSV